MERSTTSNLVTFINDISEVIDNNKQTDTIYTDFKKVFDRVPHDILLKKLAVYGFSGSMLNWMKSYLKDQLYYVMLEGFLSNKLTILSGMPQGSHLGLYYILSYLYADDMNFEHVVLSPDDCRCL